MIGSTKEIRRARPEDAPVLVELINMAGEGLPLAAWQAMAGPGEDAWDVGRARVRGEEAGTSHRNGWVLELDGSLAGVIFAYSQPDTPKDIPPDLPAMFRPIQELENEAPGTGYVYILATLPHFQGQGVGTTLLDHAERYRGPKGMSIVVSNGNPGAMRLYQRCGYVERARRVMVKQGWENPGTEWVLMVKP